MSDTSNPFAGFSSFFFPNEQGTNLKLREKIALAQMMKKQAYPKTLGEGFASIGDSISDIITMRGLEKSDREAQLAASKLGAPKEAGAITPVSYAPTEDVPQEKTLTPPIAAAQPAQPSIVTPPQQPPVVAPAEPLPASELPSTDPNTPYRLTNPARLDNWRRENPVRGVPPIPGQSIAPPVPPPALPVPLSAQPPAQNFNDRFSPAGTGRRSAAEPPAGAGVMAFGGEPSENVPSPVNQRDLVAATLAKRGAGAPALEPPAAFAQPAPNQSIQPAPPDAFQRVAQAQPQAIPGYVPPALVDPTRATIISPGKRERELQVILNANQGNPYAAQSPAAIELKSLQDDRAKQQDLADKKMEASIARATKREEQRQQALIDQDKRILESQKSGIELEDLPTKLRQEGEKRAQELRRGLEPTLREDVETKHIYDPATGSYRAPKIEGADPNQKPPFKGTEFQGKGVVNLGRAMIANEGLLKPVGGGTETGEQALANSRLQSGLSSIPFGAGRSFRSDAYKEADAHAENFVQAFIRQQSGAGFSKEELEAEARSMLPRYGDPPKVIQDKREQRDQFARGLYGVIGSSGQKGLDIDAAKRAAEREKTAAKPKYEEGDEAVWPDKTIRVYRDGKWVPK